MRIIDVTVTPNSVTTGETITVSATVLANQGFLTANKLLLKTKDGSTFIVEDV